MRRKSNSSDYIDTQFPPALHPEDRENELIVLAMKRTEMRIRDGTASSQELTHFLKLAAEKEKRDLELEKLRKENELLRAKTEAIEAAPRLEEMYKAAVDAMRDYSGNGAVDNDEGDDDDQELY